MPVQIVATRRGAVGCSRHKRRQCSSSNVHATMQQNPPWMTSTIATMSSWMTTLMRWCVTWLLWGWTCCGCWRSIPLGAGSPTRLAALSRSRLVQGAGLLCTRELGARWPGGAAAKLPGSWHGTQTRPLPRFTSSTTSSAHCHTSCALLVAGWGRRPAVWPSWPAGWHAAAAGKLGCWVVVGYGFLGPLPALAVAECPGAAHRK